MRVNKGGERNMPIVCGNCSCEEFKIESNSRGETTLTCESCSTKFILLREP
jgi:hypothetical protein